MSPTATPTDGGSDTPTVSPTGPDDTGDTSDVGDDTVTGTSTPSS
jgi:hypothetical protein